MDDDELKAIRAARLKELQSQPQPARSGNPGVLSVLAPAARERLERVRMVKPDRAALIESQISQIYRGGVISEEDIISLLKQLDQQSQQSGKISFMRRNGGDLDSDSDFE